jgi:hypothetical protein
MVENAGENVVATWFFGGEDVVTGGVFLSC